MSQFNRLRTKVSDLKQRVSELAVWDEAKYRRAKTTPGSRGGSFAPKIPPLSPESTLPDAKGRFIVFTSKGLRYAPFVYGQKVRATFTTNEGVVKGKTYVITGHRTVPRSFGNTSAYHLDGKFWTIGHFGLEAAAPNARA
jgi:hypothetical protein